MDLQTTGSVNNIVSLSGGKDSTAMLLMMLERKESIHSIVFFDTGWEFPQTYGHIRLLENKIGRRIWRLQSKFPFDYWLTARPIVARKSKDAGKITRIGHGWPSPSRRWCTREKVDTIRSFSKPISQPVQCIGYAADEQHRHFSDKNDKNVQHRFPLQEWGISEADALKYCYRAGYDWGGLYEHFPRVSCFCCPLQRLGELRTLRKYFFDLWHRMLCMENMMPPGTNRGFKDYTTVHDFEQRFAEEDRQIIFPFKERAQASGVDTVSPVL